MEDSDREEELGRRRRRAAYRVANWHVVRAGLALALAGVRPDAPEIRALRAALREVNRAGGLEEPGAGEARKEAMRVPSAGGAGRTGRQGGVA